MRPDSKRQTIRLGIAYAVRLLSEQKDIIMSHRVGNWRTSANTGRVVSAKNWRWAAACVLLVFVGCNSHNNGAGGSGKVNGSVGSDKPPPAKAASVTSAASNANGSSDKDKSRSVGQELTFADWPPQSMDATIDEAIAKADRAKPAATLSALAGTWEAAIVAIEAPVGDHLEVLDTSEAPPLRLTIKPEGDQYVLAPEPTSKWRPRVLVIQDGRVVGKGKPPLSLTLSDNLLIGSLEQNGWRLEFHAKRAD